EAKIRIRNEQRVNRFISRVDQSRVECSECVVGTCDYLLLQYEAAKCVEEVTVQNWSRFLRIWKGVLEFPPLLQGECAEIGQHLWYVTQIRPMEKAVTRRCTSVALGFRTAHKAPPRNTLTSRTGSKALQ